MSLWLSIPTVSLSDFPLSVLHGHPFLSHSAVFIFLWTFLVTAVIILLIAIRTTYRARTANAIIPFLKPSLASRLRRFGAVKWEDEERAGGKLKNEYVNITI